MGLLDFLFVVADTIDTFSDHDTHFKVTCDTLELFEIGTSWQGTARVHGAGSHIRTQAVSYATTVTMPHEDDHDRTKRSILRDRLRKWASETFADGSMLPKEAIVLNDSENCLSCEGFVKQVGNQWIITTNMQDAKYYGAYKLFLKKSGETVGYEELAYLFKAPTVGYVSSVDVHDDL